MAVRVRVAVRLSCISIILGFGNAGQTYSANMTVSAADIQKSMRFARPDNASLGPRGHNKFIDFACNFRGRSTIKIINLGVCTTTRYIALFRQYVRI